MARQPRGDKQDLNICAMLPPRQRSNLEAGTDGGNLRRHSCSLSLFLPRAGPGGPIRFYNNVFPDDCSVNVMISDLDIAIRLVVAAVLSSIVGFERERHLWAAGIRTHMLVSVGAALMMIVSAYGFEHAITQDHVILDPSRIAAQVVSGIGFLGAGAILLRGQVVRGLTTAASIWTVAGIGLACGGGLYFAAVFATALIVGILAGIRPIEDAYRARAQSCEVRIKAKHDQLAVDQIRKLLGIRVGQVKRIVIAPAEEGIDDISVVLIRVARRDVEQNAAQLRSHDAVLNVEVGNAKG
jgi:putative Mg2+ transporter-C (MgtC) family protein